MGIERVLLELAELEMDKGYEENIREKHWPLILIEDHQNQFDSRVLTIRSRLLEKFPGISIEIITLKPAKVGQMLGKLSEVGSSLI